MDDAPMKILPAEYSITRSHVQTSIMKLTITSRVRCMIWDMVFTANGTKQDSTMVLQAHRESPDDIHLNPHPHQLANNLAVTKLCRELRRETFPALFLQSKLEVDISLAIELFEIRSDRSYIVKALKALKLWLSTVPSANKIQGLTIFVRERPADDILRCPLWTNVNRLLPASQMATLLPRLREPVQLELLPTYQFFDSSLLECNHHQPRRRASGAPDTAFPDKSRTFTIPLGDKTLALLAFENMIGQIDQVVEAVVAARVSQCAADPNAVQGTAQCSCDFDEDDAALLKASLFGASNGWSDGESTDSEIDDMGEEEESDLDSEGGDLDEVDLERDVDDWIDYEEESEFEGDSNDGYEE